MVVFTCQNCGESLRKNAVEKHYNQTRCRNENPNLTCVDCLKDFFGEGYIGHTSCLTEDQKYSAKGTVFKEAKGKKKQELYTDVIQNLILHKKDIPRKQKMLLVAIQDVDNVPRKLKGFLNFIKNNKARQMNASLNDITEVFHLIEKAFQEVSSASKESSSTQKGPESKEENQSPDKLKKEERPVPNEKIGENGNTEGSKENKAGLSRKELKKKSKHEKYLKELENVQLEILPDISMDDDDNSNVKKKKTKKSKKNKLEETSGSTKVQLEAFNGVQENDVERKKSKKRKLEVGNIGETEGKKSKISAAEDQDQTDSVQTSFDWSDVIVRVLESRPEKELSLKKLAKKVVNEYLTVKSDHHTYEELMAKFNKKVKKTKAVRVLKDRAKLIVE